MTDTFKSGQWRICAGCLASIKPRDRVCILYDEIHCMNCLTDDEETEALSGEAEGKWAGDDIDSIIDMTDTTPRMGG